MNSPYWVERRKREQKEKEKREEEVRNIKSKRTGGKKQ